MFKQALLYFWSEENIIIMSHSQKFLTCLLATKLNAQIDIYVTTSITSPSMEFKLANLSMAFKNASSSAADALTILSIPYCTSSPVRSPNNHIFNGAVDEVTRDPIKPIKSSHLSAPVENLNWKETNQMTEKNQSYKWRQTESSAILCTFLQQIPSCKADSHSVLYWTRNSLPYPQKPTTGPYSFIYSAFHRSTKVDIELVINPLSPKLNPICYLLALLGAHHFIHVSRIRVRLLSLRLLMSYIYGAPILDVSRSHTTTQHSR